MLITHGDLSVGSGAGDDYGGERAKQEEGCGSAVEVKAMRCSMSEQGQAGAFGEQRQSHAETPLANEAGRVE